MPKDKSRFNLPDVKHLLTAGGLVVGTLGTLLLGAALQVDPQTVASERAVLTAPPVAGGSVAPNRPAPLPPTSQPETADEAAASKQTPTPQNLSSKPASPQSRKRATQKASPTPTGTLPGAALAARADDAQRLIAGDGEWTLQFMVTCNNQSAANLLQDVNNDSRLFLLPLTMDGRACYRICWDTYRSRDRARAASNIPAALQAINAEPIPRQSKDVAR